MTRHVASRGTLVPKGYEIRKEQVRFMEEASASLKKGGVFLGSAPCGTGKSLASLLAVLPCLTKKKLLISFRTRSQLHIYLKELRALGRVFRTVSFYSKKAMCPLNVKSDLSYFDFFDECKRLKENCRTSTKPFCKFFWNVYRRKKRADELAVDCTKRVLTPQQAVRYMSKEGFCAYEALKRVLKDVDIFLGTYHYVFSPPIRDSRLLQRATF
jgi:Rad3-related DNA helicase